MLRSGVDLIEIKRIRKAVERYRERFLARVFTAGELALCAGRSESLAGRFAAKEAVAKALGTGIWHHNITWIDIEVLRGAEGEPLLVLHNAAAQHANHLGIHEWSLSISHDRKRVVAFVVAL